MVFERWYVKMAAFHFLYYYYFLMLWRSMVQCHLAHAATALLADLVRSAQKFSSSNSCHISCISKFCSQSVGSSTVKGAMFSWDWGCCETDVGSSVPHGSQSVLTGSSLPMLSATSSLPFQLLVCLTYKGFRFNSLHQHNSISSPAPLMALG